MRPRVSLPLLPLQRLPPALQAESLGAAEDGQLVLEGRDGCLGRVATGTLGGDGGMSFGQLGGQVTIPKKRKEKRYSGEKEYE
jgi:hypothetical protein